MNHHRHTLHLEAGPFSRSALGGYLESELERRGNNARECPDLQMDHADSRGLLLHGNLRHYLDDITRDREFVH